MQTTAVQTVQGLTMYALTLVQRMRVVELHMRADLEFF